MDTPPAAPSPAGSPASAPAGPLAAALARRAVLRASAAGALGVGAGLAGGAVGGPAAYAAPTSRGIPILQPGQGKVRGQYVRSRPDEVWWGHLPNRTAEPVAVVSSGSVVTLDTISHEGLLGLSDGDGPEGGANATSLDLAMKDAVEQALAFLVEEQGMSGPVAYAYLSAATDFQVSQVVDRTTGIHAMIRKADFGWADDGGGSGERCGTVAGWSPAGS